MSLNDMQCRVAKPSTKRYCLTDREGLYLEVMPSGKKYWRIKYRFEGTERRTALGAYPATGISEARKKRDNIKNMVQDGIDPILAKLEKLQNEGYKDSPTFEELAIEWHSTGISTWDPRYAATLKHRMEKYIFPYFGNFPIKLLKPTMVLICLRKIENTAPDMARRIKQIISLVFKYAIATGKVENDITYGLETALKKYKKGHFSSIEVEDLPDFLVALNNHKSRLYRQTALLIELMLLTFVRTSELIEAKWTEIDLEKAIWTIPAERMKMRSPHLVPLSRQAVLKFVELKQMNEKREYVFPSIPRPRKPMSKGTILVALKRMGYNNRMTGHGFRALALGILKEKLGYSHEIADRQLAHAPRNSTDRAYDRAKFLDQRTAMMQKYADYIDKVFLDEIGKAIRSPLIFKKKQFSCQPFNYEVGMKNYTVTFHSP